MVRVSAPHERMYCFGSAAVQGKRVCDVKQPNYAVLHDPERGHDVYELYGKKFAFIPNYRISTHTKAAGQATESDKVRGLCILPRAPMYLSVYVYVYFWLVLVVFLHHNSLYLRCLFRK